eukprot:CCRYP_004905-RA/>CCRYP_004905-RA protein AED:0.40 eAED:0.40 QI:87/1/0.5/1/0/0/2/121/27
MRLAHSSFHKSKYACITFCLHWGTFRV